MKRSSSIKLWDVFCSMLADFLPKRVVSHSLMRVLLETDADPTRDDFNIFKQLEKFDPKNTPDYRNVLRLVKK